MGIKKLFWGSIIAFLLGSFAHAQTCQFSVYYAGKPYSMNTLKYLSDDTLMVLQLKCYVRYQDPKKKTWEHKLLDFYLAKAPLELRIPKGVDSVQLFFGVDSALQEKGIGTGDLDPKNNMYWGWFPGYIGVKVEGVSLNHGSFEYHLGGFRRFNSNQSFIWVKPKKHYAIDLEEFISKIPAEKSGKIMSPGPNIPTFVDYFVQSIHELD